MPSRPLLYTLAALLIAAAAPASALIGDCNRSGRVQIDDLVTGANVLLGETPLGTCATLDASGDGDVAVDELVVALLHALGVLPPLTGITCGDGFRADDEQCDDGNMHDADGCGSDCRLEGVGALDQTWLGTVPAGCGGSNGTVNIGSVGPLAQEVVPQRSTVTSVLVNLARAGNAQAASLRLNVRRGSYDGPVLAWTTATVRLPDDNESVWQPLVLPAPLAVTPGATYVLELQSLEDQVMWARAGGLPTCTEPGYTPGDPVSQGGRAADEDYLFAAFGGDAPGVGAVDQAWLGPQGICGQVHRDVWLGSRAVAQTFTPTGDALGAIAVQLIAEPGDDRSAALTLTLRAGGAGGAALASVSRAVLAPNGGAAWYVFTLPAPLAVTPGATYAIELADAAGRDRFLWSGVVAGDEGCPEPSFGGGSAFVDGAEAATDFPFAVYAPVD
jgi:cysteine-rich repeat protein